MAATRDQGLGSLYGAAPGTGEWPEAPNSLARMA